MFFLSLIKSKITYSNKNVTADWLRLMRIMWNKKLTSSKPADEQNLFDFFKFWSLKTWVIIHVLFDFLALMGMKFSGKMRLGQIHNPQKFWILGTFPLSVIDIFKSRKMHFSEAILSNESPSDPCDSYGANCYFTGL